MTPHQFPQTPNEFASFMALVWDGQLTAVSEGTILTGSPLYDAYHDAILSAKRFGMIRTGGTRVDNEDWEVFRFPHRPGGVRIKRDGSACELSTVRFGRKK
jgi:hypothetical protein